MNGQPDKFRCVNSDLSEGSKVGGCVDHVSFKACPLFFNTTHANISHKALLCAAKQCILKIRQLLAYKENRAVYALKLGKYFPLYGTSLFL